MQLVSNDKYIKILQGVKTKAKISLYIDNQYIKSVLAEVLWTKYGVSGDGILDISRDVSQNFDKNIVIHIKLLPNIDNTKLFHILQERRKNLQGSSELLLSSLINEKLILYILKKLHLIKDIKLLNNKDLHKIIYEIKNIKINITDTKGFEFAEVINGGIDINEINKNFELKKYPNIYVCGEVLDIDGECGGYNIHFAISNGYHISKNIDCNLTNKSQKGNK